MFGTPLGPRVRRRARRRRASRRSGGGWLSGGRGVAECRRRQPAPVAGARRRSVRAAGRGIGLELGLGGRLDRHAASGHDAPAGCDVSRALPTPNTRQQARAAPPPARGLWARGSWARAAAWRRAGPRPARPGSATRRPPRGRRRRPRRTPRGRSRPRRGTRPPRRPRRRPPGPSPGGRSSGGPSPDCAFVGREFVRAARRTFAPAFFGFLVDMVISVAFPRCRSS